MSEKTMLQTKKPILPTPAAASRQNSLVSQPPLIQAKLTIGQPNDRYEQEADRVADTVMRMPDPKVQRQPEEEKKEDDKEEAVQAKPIAGQITPLVQTQTTAAHTPEVTPAMEANINALRGGGHPLDPATRGFMEPRFGHDFSQVRVHTDARAAESARAMNALAYTVGKNIVFGTGQYSQGSEAGRRLLAHELAHVLQQEILHKPYSLQRKEEVTSANRDQKYGLMSRELKTLSSLNTWISPVFSFKDWELGTLLEKGMYKAVRNGKTYIWKLRFQGNQTILSDLVKSERIRFIRSARLFKVLGVSMAVAGGVISFMQWENRDIGTPEFTADMVFTGIAFIPPYGWIVSGVYFVGKEVGLPLWDWLLDEITRHMNETLKRLISNDPQTWIEFLNELGHSQMRFPGH